LRAIELFSSGTLTQEETALLTGFFPLSLDSRFSPLMVRTGLSGDPTKLDWMPLILGVWKPLFQGEAVHISISELCIEGDLQEPKTEGEFTATMQAMLTICGCCCYCCR